MNAMCDNHPDRTATEEVRVWRNEVDYSEQSIVCIECANAIVKDAVSNDFAYLAEDLL